MKRLCKLVLATSVVVTPLLAMTAQAGTTLDGVRERGKLNCGVSTGTSIGKSFLNDQGEWSGFEVDFCRAVATSILGDPSAVNFVPLEFKNAFAALTSASVDMLARGATWTFSRDFELGFEWAGIYLYDGQGFLVSKASGVTDLAGLDGASICVGAGTTTELNLGDYFRTNGMDYTPVVVSTVDQSLANLESGRCDAYTNEVGGIGSYRLGLSDPDAYTILAEVISREPLGPVVRQDDPQFEDVVEWTLNAMVIAESHGITMANVAEMAANSTIPEVKRLLGVEGEFGAMAGLENDWVVTLISEIGNYGELYDRTLGKDSAAQITRGQNNLWYNGGLIYAPPVR